jgi:hypothetical protein
VMRVVFVLVGLGMLLFGAGLALDLRRAVDWWIQYSSRQRDLFGRGTGPSYNRGSARLLGLITAMFGVMFPIAGITLG